MYKSKITSLISVIFIASLLSSSNPVSSAETGLDWSAANTPASQFLLAAADDAQSDTQDLPSGTLVLPAASEQKEAEKKCMTVCQKWGQDCVYDNQRGRKCRRTCKQFGQECF